MRRLCGKTLPRSLDPEDVRQEACLAWLEFRQAQPDGSANEAFRFIRRRLYKQHNAEYTYSHRYYTGEQENMGLASDQGQQVYRLWVHLFLREVLQIADARPDLFEPPRGARRRKDYLHRNMARARLRKAGVTCLC